MAYDEVIFDVVDDNHAFDCEEFPTSHASRHRKVADETPLWAQYEPETKKDYRYER